MNKHTIQRMNMRPGVLVLADGSMFEGELFGAELSSDARNVGADRNSGVKTRFGTPAAPAASAAAGEIVFNTAMSGYQEVLTDPSYAGQIITFTNPHIGNYGVNAADFESRGLFCRGVVVRDLARRHSNRRAEGDLDSLLQTYGVAGITGIDTRRLTRLIRTTGAVPGAFGSADVVDALRVAAAAEPGTDGIDLVATVTTAQPYTVPAADRSSRRIVAYDYGIKRTILRHLTRLGTVDVVPATTPAAEVLAREPDGIFLSNGPGDPAYVAGAAGIIEELLGSSVPMFGICLGHQLLATAIGGTTVKLPFGHHGANHPVQDLATGRIEITSQNHNFAVAADGLGGVATITHVNLNDGVCEGLEAKDANAYSVQHHPEAGPGPHDSAYLFERFAARMTH
jgi:carbamoyl-phosphate synthase small subunit